MLYSYSNYAAVSRFDLEYKRRMLYGVHLMKSVLGPRYLTNHRNENLTFKNYIDIPLHLNWHKCSFHPVTSYFL